MMSRNAVPGDHQHGDFDQFITANHLGDLISITDVIILFLGVRYVLYVTTRQKYMKIMKSIT